MITLCEFFAQKLNQCVDVRYCDVIITLYFNDNSERPTHSVAYVLM